ncbi:MAG: glycerol-3-phosphate acyltransferase [candidate division WOR-3 bacterium]|jgi:glycerol-3-phosphate acyltransferase PlsY
MRTPALLLPLLGFISGSMMFSLWLGKLRGRDIRQFGDGNPGAVNAFRAAGPIIGSISLMLDFLKGMVPAGVGFWQFHLAGIPLALLVLTPVLGHAFSPFLRFKGGKALAVTFGVWSGITLWQVPVFLGAMLLITRFVFRLKKDALCVVITMLCLPVFVGIIYRSLPLLVAALGNSGLVILKHRHQCCPGFRC